MTDDLYVQTITCPICNNIFKSTKVKVNKVRVLKRDTDFFRYFKGENPYLYEINVCGRCGFAFPNNFNEHLSKYDKAKFLKTISAHWNGQDFSGIRDIIQAIETFKLALLSGQVVGLRVSSLAGLCLRIAWLNRLNGNIPEEKRFIKNAIELYEKAYKEEDLNRYKGTSSEMVVYLLGELNYRIGDYRQCMEWFNLAISKYVSSSLTDRQMAETIRSRWLDIREDVSAEVSKDSDIEK